MEKLVSVLTPCFNGEKFIHRLLDSILMQTYPHIEMHVIDDGSTDNSKDVIQSYISKFEERGYQLHYYYQNNSGQSAAINNGLKLIHGDYLVWPDCDDWYATDDAIEQMVRILDNSDDTVSIVRCQYRMLSEKNLEEVCYKQLNKVTKNKLFLFEDCVFEKNGFWCEPGGYMAKVNIVNKAIPDREIYTEKGAGQNWQILFPLLYHYKCVTIEKFLYNYLIRENSHSRCCKTISERIKQNNIYERTALSTMDRLIIPDKMKKKYKSRIRCKYVIRRIRTYLLYNVYTFSVVTKFLTFKRLRNLNYVLLISILLNIIFFYLDFFPIIRDGYNRLTTQYISYKEMSIKQFEKLLVMGVVKRLKSNSVVDNDILITNNNIGQRLKKLVMPDISVYDFGEHAFLMYFSLLGSTVSNNHELMTLVKTRFDDYCLNKKFDRVDQSIYGNVAIELFKQTKDPKYKDFADNIFSLLNKRNQLQNTILYRDGKNQQVDLLGFVCPFLFEYANTFNSNLAEEIGMKLINDYVVYGIDKQTGIPVQGYNIRTKIKSGYSDWGRGTAWYLIALSFAKDELLSEECKNAKIQITKTLENLIQKNDGKLYQFLGATTGKMDMSAMIPFYYFLQKTRCLSKKSTLVKLFNASIMEDGLIGYNSPSIATHQNVIKYMPHDMVQGLFYYLFTIAD